MFGCVSWFRAITTTTTNSCVIRLVPMRDIGGRSLARVWRKVLSIAKRWPHG